MRGGSADQARRTEIGCDGSRNTFDKTYISSDKEGTQIANNGDNIYIIHQSRAQAKRKKKWVAAYHSKIQFQNQSKAVIKKMATFVAYALLQGMKRFDAGGPFAWIGRTFHLDSFRPNFLRAHALYNSQDVTFRKQTLGVETNDQVQNEAYTSSSWSPGRIDGPARF